MKLSILALFACSGLALGGQLAPQGPSAPQLPRNGLAPTVYTTGGLAVFTGDLLVDGVNELFATKLDGSPPWRVSAPLPPGGSISNVFWVAPNGQYVAYTGVQEATGGFGLFAAPIDGSSFVRLSQPGGSLQSPGSASLWSRDSQWLAFLDKASGGRTELWAVRPDGSSPAQLSSVAQPLGNVLDFAWTRQGSARVAFRGDLAVDNKNELYTATPDGLGSVRINPNMPSNSDVDAYVWSPDGSSLACLGDVTTPGANELYVSGPDGTSFHSVTAAHALPGTSLSHIEWTPDSKRLVFIANAQSASELDLWAVHASGSGWTKLSGSQPAGGGVVEFRIAPDGSRVAYRADQTAKGRVELYTTRIDGSGNVPVSGPFVIGGAVATLGSFAWSPSSAHLAYTADQEVDQRSDVFITAPDGSGNFKVSGQFYPTSSSALGLSPPWSSDSKRLVFTTLSFGGHPITVRSDGSGAVEVSGPLVAGGAASDGFWSSDGKRIVFRATKLTFGVQELFASNPGGGNNQLLSGSIVSGGNVGTFKVH